MKAKPMVVVTLAAILTSALGSASAPAEKRGPSTPEERKRAVEVARALEQDPLNKNLINDREWALRFVIEVPDIKVSVCTTVMAPVTASKKNHSSELLVIYILSSAAHVIENPQADDAAANLAGLEGVLRAYEVILKSKPKAHHAHLDEMIEKRSNDSLGQHVQEVVSKCKEPQ